MLPNFVGIGAPKSATTWIYRCLDEHPEVFVSNVKETNYFSWRYESIPESKYEKYFKEAENEKAVGEVCTAYLENEQAPKRIHDLIPNAKLFVSLRSPVDQVYSHFWHLLRQNFHQSEKKRPDSFEEALDMYPDRLLKPANYYTHIKRWTQYYKLEKIHIIIFDDLKENPQSTIQCLYGFLNVDPRFVPSGINKRDRSVRKGSSPRGPVFEKIYIKIYNLLINKIKYPISNAIGHKKTEKIKNKLRVREVMEFLFRSEGYPEMKEETRSFLKSYFKEEVENLESLIERDLSDWK